MNHRLISGLCVLLAGQLFHSSVCQAQEDNPPADPFKLGAYVEAVYSWNFNEPRNEVTNFRGFDNRHDSFTLSNLVFDAAAARQELSARVTLQFGHTPNTYYLAEPVVPATSGAGESDRFTWRYVQQAYVGWQPARVPQLLCEAGLFLSPVGPEGIAVKDNWNWSRSNLFFALPFYHTGIRATYSLTPTTKLAGMVMNGWNSVVDNNRHKTIHVQLLHSRRHLDAAVGYMGGAERAAGAPEGGAWRHLFDGWVRVQASEPLALMAHANAGVEDNDVAQSMWYAAALYARLRLTSWLFAAGRGDWFVEEADLGSTGRPTPIFWGQFDADGKTRVTSATVTLEAQPVEGLSIRSEYRYDDSNVELFFDDQATAAPNIKTQSTVTFGTVVWF
jgi:hypothetical protein